jgi:aspartate carbamoyltransferase regulatory subunit
MADEHNMRRVTAIRNGTVIDHIPSGQSLKVLELLNIARDTSVPVSLGHERTIEEDGFKGYCQS